MTNSTFPGLRQTGENQQKKKSSPVQLHVNTNDKSKDYWEEQSKKHNTILDNTVFKGTTESI